MPVKWFLYAIKKVGFIYLWKCVEKVGFNTESKMSAVYSIRKF